MKYSLRTKLSLSYVFVALFLVAVLSLLANSLLEKQFRDYITKQQDEKNREFVNLIGQQYDPGTSVWDKAVIENIGINALEQGLIIKVKDIRGNTVWDATQHNNGLCLQMLNHMSQNMSSRYPNFQGGYVENSFDMKRDFTKVGTAEIGYYGPFYLNDNDLAFINTLNRMLLGVGILSMIFALIVGVVMADRLSMPISRVITAARQISAGYFGGRITEKSSTREIMQLTSTVNNLAETLERQENLRKRLTGDVAHELRTPLATLQSHLEAMIDGIWEPDTGRLTSCHEEIMRINRMVGDLEKLARYESENLVLTKESFDASELAQHIIRNFESDFSNKGVRLDFEGEQKVINADKDKISQVLINLISNALKYTPAGGGVKITVNGPADAVEIRVEDTGMGIPPEDLPYIFERFYRADKSRNRMTGGSGIGLTIVKAIVEAHGGTVAVRSELNKGTELVVRLPA